MLNSTAIPMSTQPAFGAQIPLWVRLAPCFIIGRDRDSLDKHFLQNRRGLALTVPLGYPNHPSPVLSRDLGLRRFEPLRAAALSPRLASHSR